jgi:DNA helicase-2/ATP-dependent DNA helicase PcrA
MSFYQRKEIKDLLAYFRLALNNKDEESLKRVINYPVRGIGLRSIEKISVAANENDITPWEVIENLNQYNLRIGAASVAKILDFVSMIKSFSADTANKNAYDLGNHIATSSGSLKELYDSQAPEDIVRYENVQELLNGLKEFCETWSHNNAEGHDLFEGPSLTEYIQDIALLTDADEDDPNDNDRVSLMTIHAAKGLEFPYVFVVGLEENLFPSQLSLNSKEDLEEERRLFYVAITRARERAFLSFATTRYRWGNLIHCEPSRFLEEVDDKYLDFPATRKISEPLHIFDNPAKLKRSAINEKSKKTNTVKSKLEPLNKKLVRLNKAIRASSNTFEADNTDNLQAGMEVEHQRFGIGKVLQIEGDHSNQKATVFFQATGQKQLLLKFAKLKILNGGSQ